MPPVSDESVDPTHAQPAPGAEPLPAAAAAVSLPALQREVLTPREQASPTSNLAVLCSMAGVASGFALIATVAVAQLSAPIGARHGHGGCPERARAHLTIGPAIDLSGAGFLGVRYADGPTGAAQVQAVFAGSPAAVAGVRPGDIILTAGGEVIDRPGELREIVRAAGVGSVLPITIERDGLVTPLQPTLAAFRGR